MKLIVGGCSVSDYLYPRDGLYGNILAKKIGADYVHHAKSGGSNYRIWKKITQMVMNHQITKDDIVIIQYTQVNRQEYWSASSKPEQFWRESLNAYQDNHMQGGSIISFKAPADSLLGKTKIEENFFKLKEQYFTCSGYDEERFEYNHFLFHNLMVSKNIKVAYLVSPTSMPLVKYSSDVLNRYNKNGELHITLSQSNDEYFAQKDNGTIDYYHFGKKGHEYVAIEIEKFIRQNQWL